MLLNYLKVTIRYLLRSKVYSFMTVFGLATGVATAVVIWKYVEFQLSYDNFHRNGNDIYRALFTDYVNGEKIDSSPRFGYGLGPALLQDLPEVQSYTRTHGLGGDEAIVIYSGEQESRQFREKKLLFVDSTFLDIFTFKALEGNVATALDLPSSIVLTKSAAARYFGKNVDPIGRTLRVYTTYWGKGDYVVTAVLQDVPLNSHITFDFLIPIHNLLMIDGYREPNAEWDWVNFITYVQMHRGVDIRNVNAKTDALLTKYTGPNPPGTFIFTFQSLGEIHPSEAEDDPLNSIYFLILVAILILGIAWVNYIILTTARAGERSREIGVKKAVGAAKQQLIHQFLVESCVMNFLAVALSVILSMMLLPVLSRIVGIPLSLEFSERRFWYVLGALFITGSLASGTYPAFVLTSFKTTSMLKGDQMKEGGGLIRNAMVAFQFTAALLLLTATFTTYRQVRFMEHSKTGVDMESLLIVTGPKILEGDVDQRLASFKQELLQYSRVLNASTSSSVPGGGFGLVTGVFKLGTKPRTNETPTGYIAYCDFDFATTYELQLISGRTLNVGVESDRRSVLINEAALSAFGLGDAGRALNEKLIVDETDTVSIAGVFKNIHWNSLHTKHIPILLWPKKVARQHFSIRLNGDLLESVASIKNLYERHFPGNPFDYYFLDDSFNQQYKADEQFEQILSLFGAGSALIACLGLSALASFTTRARLKEISIRKVLGASSGSIVSLLSGQFLKLIFVSALIAFPVAWYFMDSWLETFAFRVNVSWDLFIVPLLLLFLISMATVTSQTIRGAITNPVHNLRGD
jgi:putative ABC transport system permease protein